MGKFFIEFWLPASVKEVIRYILRQVLWDDYLHGIAGAASGRDRLNHIVLSGGEDSRPAGLRHDRTHQRATILHAVDRQEDIIGW